MNASSGVHCTLEGSSGNLPFARRPTMTTPPASATSAAPAATGHLGGVALDLSQQ